jgi:NAD(P)-dependent dehydrogenase (short-subunit alcohol dehydrogenase family)
MILDGSDWRAAIARHHPAPHEPWIRSILGEYQKKGFAYALSKNFVVWYAKKCAFEYGPRGIRVVSLSPGLIATDMGNLEKEDGGMLIPLTAEERMGRPEELGFALATVADERNGYLAGVDVLCDGGSVTGKKFKKNKK